MEDDSVKPVSDADSDQRVITSRSDASEDDEQNGILLRGDTGPDQINEVVAASDVVNGDEHESIEKKGEGIEIDNLCISGFTSDSYDACKIVEENESNDVTIEANSSAKKENDDDRGTSSSASETDNDTTDTSFQEKNDIRTNFALMSVNDRLDNLSLHELNGAQDTCELKDEKTRISQPISSTDNVRCSLHLESNDTGHSNISDLSETFRQSKPDETTMQYPTNLRKYHSVEEISDTKRQLQPDVTRVTFPNLSKTNTRTSYSLDFLNTDTTNTNEQSVDEEIERHSPKEYEIPARARELEQIVIQRFQEEYLSPNEHMLTRPESESVSDSEADSDSESDSESETDSEYGSETEFEEEMKEVETPPESPVVLRRQTSFQRELADAIVRLAPLDELELLLRCGAKVSEAVTQGLTPLHYAVWQRYPKAAELLIREGCDLNARDDIGYTPLHLCAEHGYIDMMNVLLHHNAIVNFNHPEDDDLFPIDAVDEPLRLALKHDQIEAARLLLESGANPNGRYFFGSEINLVSSLKTEQLELLLSWGAQPDSRDRYGFTPIMKACHVQQEAEEQLQIRDTISGNDVLQHFAHTLKGIESVLVLISHGADINMRTDARHECRSVLHYAILSGSSPIVSLLIKQGAKVNFEPEYNRESPLHLAVLKGDANMINMLLDSGAVMNITTPTVGSPLHVACSEDMPNRMEVLQLLLERGADPNIVVRNASGRPLKPPLGQYLANFANHDLEVIKIMLRYGAQVVMQAPQQCPLGLLNCLYTVAKNKEVMIEVLEAAERFDVPLIHKTPLLVPPSHRELFLTVAANPPSLRHLSRVFVRQVMKNRRPEAVDDLALPKLLRQYLLYEIN